MTKQIIKYLILLLSILLSKWGISQCNANAGSDITIDCNITNTTLIGTGGITYAWTPAAGLSDPSIANPIANPTSTTTYTLTVTGTDGCTETDDVTITVDIDAPSADAGLDAIIGCANTSTLLTATGGITYTWTPTVGLDNPNIPNPTATPTVTTTYTVTARGSNGCLETDDVDVTIDVTPPTVNAGVDVINDCNSPTSNLNATGAVNYTWTPSIGINLSNIGNPIANPSVTTTYTVTGTAANGCTATDDIKVTIDKTPPIANAGPGSGTTCASLNAQLLASGGVGYSWFPTTALSNPLIPNPIASPPTTTTYTVTVTGSNGCTATDQTLVTLNDVTPSSNAGSDINLCGVYTTPLSPDISSNQPTDFFNWSAETTNPTLVTFTNVNTPISTIGNLQEGIYNIYWTVSNNVCPPIQDLLLINVYDPPVANAGIDDSICAADNTNLNASLNGTATGIWTIQSDYSNPNPAAILFTDVTDPTTNVSGLEEGVYHFIWTVSNGTCTDDKDTVSINVFNTPISNAGIDIDLCAQYNTNLGATLPLTISTGSWSEEPGFSSPSTVTFSDNSLINTNISNLSEGIYHLIWKVENGNCPIAEDTVSINVYDSPIANAGVDAIACGIDHLNLDTLNFLNANLPLGTSSGLWTLDLSYANPSTAVFIHDTSYQAGVTNFVEGVYQFIWTVSNGTCPDATDIIQVSAFDNPKADGGNDQEICGIYTVNHNADVPVGTSTGLWSTDVNLNNPSTISFTDDTSPTTSSNGYVEGIYKLLWTVSNSNCSPETDTILITIYDTPIANAGDDVEICATSIANFNAVAPTGTASSLWSEDLNFGNQNAITILDNTLNNSQSSGYFEGEYQFIWTISNGVCADDTDTVKVIRYNQPVADAGVDQYLCKLDTVLMEGIGNVGTANGRWELDPNFAYLSTPSYRDSSVGNTMSDNFIVGNYSLIWVVENGICPSDQDTVLITNKEKPVAEALYSELQCDNKCFELISLSTFQAEGDGISLLWDINTELYTDSIPFVCINEVGDYNVKLVVTAANGCQDSLIGNPTITINPSPIAGFDLFHQHDELLEAQRLDIINTASLDVISSSYNMDNGDTIYELDFLYYYNENGLYEIEQWVENEYQCRDSITYGVDVKKRNSVFIPNTFTPNGDGVNDLFGPITRNLSSDFYEFKIYTRWDELIFESYTIEESWNGMHNNKLVKNGEYYWKFIYMYEGSPVVLEKQGHVTVIK